jgi:hypothetical protein
LLASAAIVEDTFIQHIPIIDAATRNKTGVFPVVENTGRRQFTANISIQ